MKVTVTIPKTQEAKEDGKPFTFYMLHVYCEGVPEDAGVVPRRYRDFEALRNSLLLEFPMIFDTKQNPDAPQEHLEKFLQMICGFQEVLESSTVGKFLQLE